MPDLIDTVQLQEIDAGYVELFDFTLPSGTDVHLFKGLEAPSPVPFGDLNGVGSDHFSTPNVVTTWGELDIRARAQIDSISTYAFLAYKQQSFFLALITSGLTQKLNLRVLYTGGQKNYYASDFSTSQLGVRNWYRATYDAATGDVKFFTADGNLEAPAISDYVQLGATQNQGVNAIAVTTASFLAGAWANNLAAYPFDGRFYRSQVFNEIDGTTPVVDFTAGSYVSGSTLVSSTSGETWTLEGTAAISPPPPAAIYFPNKAGTVLNEYLAIPLEITGIELSSGGAIARPTLSIANIPVLSRTLDPDETTLIDEGIYKNEDLLGTIVECRSTLTTYLKVSTDTAAAPIEFPSHKFIIDRVAGESNLLVDFELASVFDVEGVTLPFRQINGRFCPWEYQGHYLGGRGGCTWALDSNSRFYDKDDNTVTLPAAYNNAAATAGTKVSTVTSGHTQIWEALVAVPANKNPVSNAGYWKRVDVCGKLISSCKVRFQGTTTVGMSTAGLNTSIPLPFGGFPGTRKFK